MYLLYDMIQLRRSSSGNAMLVKRRNWTSVRNDIASLTVEHLQDAAKEVSNGQFVTNPTVRRLQRDLMVIAIQVPESFAQKLMMRLYIRGLIIRDGMPAIWLTINPSDLRNPLVLVLAGVQIPRELLPAAITAIRHATATSDPVAVAQFFNHTCKAIFDGLLQSRTGQIGILGQVGNHFGVVETNGRGMLHLHALVWLTGNLEFTTLRERLQQDTPFARRVINYLESIIVESIISDNDDSDCTAADAKPANVAPPSKENELSQVLSSTQQASASIPDYLTPS